MNGHSVEHTQEKLIRAVSTIFKDFECLYEYDSKYDLKYVLERVRAEGFSFLTKTLPKFGDSFKLALDTGYFSQPIGFSTSRHGRPLFLVGLTKYVFDLDRKDFPLLCEPDVLAIKLVHQLTSMFKKIEVPLTQSQIDCAVDEYKTLECNYPNQLSLIGEAFTSKVIDNMQLVMSLCLDGVDLLDIDPKHGPGAVANREKYGGKYIFYPDDRLTSSYPYSEYFLSQGTYLLAESSSWDWYSNKESIRSRVHNDKTRTSGPGKVCLVPKTAKGPRVIELQPKERQWIQQGQGRKLARHFEQAPLTKGHVNFTRQSVNQRLALSGSKNGRWATLDWSKASDLIGLDLVRVLLRKDQETLRLLEASRSDYVELPDGEIIPLRKFAGMGSAVCFPLESVIFFALGVGTIAAITGTTFEHAATQVYVYGDDLIVPQRFAASVMDAGIALGMVPSEEKCFFRSVDKATFRESCGCDAFGGVDVTPVKFSKVPPKSTKDATCIAAWIDISNRFHFSGYWHTAALCKKIVDEFVFAVPCVPLTSGQFGFHSYSYGAEAYHFCHHHAYGVKRKLFTWSKDYQSFFYTAQSLKTVKEEDELSVHGRMIKNLSEVTSFRDDIDRDSVWKKFPSELNGVDDPGLWYIRDAVKIRLNSRKPLLTMV